VPGAALLAPMSVNDDKHGDAGCQDGKPDQNWRVFASVNDGLN
jgi:hypothetical protein